MDKTIVIITLFSADKVRLDEDSAARVLDGDYPVRVKSKILATIREIASATEKECVVGFLPVVRETQYFGLPYKEDITQDHYGELALYLAPEAPCSIVSDLLILGKDGHLSCRNEFVGGTSVIVIGDQCTDWNGIVTCLDEAGAYSVKCVSILE